MSGKEIKVSDPRNNNYVFMAIYEDTKVREVIEVVIDHWNLPEGNYFLAFRDTILDSKQEFGAIDINDGDEVTLAFDPQGGARPQQMWKKIISNQIMHLREFWQGYYPVIDDQERPNSRKVIVALDKAPAYTKPAIGFNSKPEIFTSHQLEINMNRDFPDVAPYAHFVSDMFHPNVFKKDNKVCIEMLNQWNDAFTLLTLVQNIEKLLWNPFDGDPANHQAISTYRDHPLEDPLRPWEKEKNATVSAIRDLPSVKRSPKIVKDSQERRGPSITGDGRNP